MTFFEQRWQQNVFLALLISAALYLFFSRPENRAAFHRHVGNTSYRLASFFGTVGLDAEKRYNEVIAP